MNRGLDFKRKNPFPLLLLSIFSSNTNICKLYSNLRWFSHCQSLGSCDWGRRTCCCSWQVHRYHFIQIHRIQFFVPSNPPATLPSNGDKNLCNCVLVQPWSLTLRALAGFLAGVRASHFFKPGATRHVLGVTSIVFNGPGQLQMQTQAKNKHKNKFKNWGVTPPNLLPCPQRTFTAFTT